MSNPLQQLMSCVDDLQSKITDGEYLQLSNLLLQAHRQQTSTVPRPVPQPVRSVPSAPRPPPQPDTRDLPRRHDTPANWSLIKPYWARNDYDESELSGVAMLADVPYKIFLVVFCRRLISIDRSWEASLIRRLYSRIDIASMPRDTVDTIKENRIFTRFIPSLFDIHNEVQMIKAFDAIYLDLDHAYEPDFIERTYQIEYYVDNLSDSRLSPDTIFKYNILHTHVEYEVATYDRGPYSRDDPDSPRQRSESKFQALKRDMSHCYHWWFDTALLVINDPSCKKDKIYLPLLALLTKGIQLSKIDFYQSYHLIKKPPIIKKPKPLVPGQSMY